MRTQWMLDWQPKGTAWSDRDPSQVYEDENPVRSSMTAFLDFLGGVGLEARVLTPELIEKGALRRGIRVLILPRVLALSEREAVQIHRFVAGGGTVIAEESRAGLTGTAGDWRSPCWRACSGRPRAQARAARAFSTRSLATAAAS